MTSRWLAAVKPAVAKFVGDFGVATEAPAGTLCVGRMVDDGWLDGQGFDCNRYYQQADDPVGIAQQYAEWLTPYIEANPRIDVWEGPNEQVPLGLVSMSWYSVFLREFARIMQAFGKRAGLGSWSTGEPDYPLWEAYGPALDGCKRYNGVLTRHTYGPMDLDNCLRYRKDNAIFASMGYPNLPLILSEIGADNVAGQTPWKGAYWGGSMDRYWDELLHPFAIELAKDDYVLGATVYTVDGNPDSQFDVSQSNLVERVANLSGADILITDWSMYQVRYIGPDYTWASRWNPANYVMDLDWAALELAPITGIWIRIGVGNTKDPVFERFVAGLMASPRFRNAWGVYHVPTPDHTDTQADSVKYWLAGRVPPYGVMSDLEIDGLTFAIVNPYLLELDDFFSRLAALYSGDWFMAAHFTRAEQQRWVGRVVEWAGYPNFVTPAGWVGQAVPYTLHQFSDNYIIPGPKRPVDMARLNPNVPYSVLLGPTHKETKVSLIQTLSFTGIDQSLALDIEKHTQDMYADVQANARVLPYAPPPPPPPPVPVLPYVARARYTIRVRNAAGAEAGLFYTGNIFPVLTDPTTIAGWQDRVVVNEKGDHVWTGAGSASGPSYEKVTVPPG